LLHRREHEYSPPIFERNTAIMNRSSNKVCKPPDFLLPSSELKVNRYLEPSIEQTILQTFYLVL
jgi:hypothetical protein